MLDLIGFPHGLVAAGAAPHAVPAEAVRNLGLIYGPGASVITAISIIILLRYRRGREDHAKVRAALDQRREA